MKISKFLYTGALLSLALMGCTDNDDHSEWYGSEGIVFTTAIQSRVSGNSWNANDEVGIYMLPAGEAIGASTAVNKKYLAQPDGTLTAAPNNGIYLPETGSVDFIAYYPFSNDVSGNKLKVNVADQTNPAAIDLIYSNGTKGISSGTSTVSLGFSHQLTKVSLNVMKDNTIETLNGLQVSMNGVSTEGEFDLGTGILVATPATNNKEVPMKVDVEGTTATVTAIILPSEVSEDQEEIDLTFDLGGEEFTHTIADASIFEAGTNVSFDVNLSINNGKPVVTVGEATIADWTEKPGGDIDVDFDGTPQPGGETVILDESFAENQGAFTIDDKNLGGLEKVWTFDATYGMKASAYDGSAVEAESWLISPELDLTDATTATLTFDHAINKGDASLAQVNHLVKVSKDNGSSWTTLSGFAYPAGTDWDFVSSGDIDLAAYVGSKIKIAFQYKSTADAAATWEIKNVKVIANGEGGGDVDPDPDPEPGVNLLVNPGFEDWTATLPTAWDNAYNTGEIVKETSIVHGGAVSLRQTSGSSTNKVQQEVAVTPGKKYRLSYWYLDNDPKARTRCWFAYNEGEVGEGMQPNDYSTDNPEWQQVVVDITVPEGASILRFEVRTYRESTDMVGGYIYYDDMSLVEIN